MPIETFLKQLKDTINNCSEQELLELYHKNVNITFNNSTVDIPFDAVVYNELVAFLTNVQKEL